MNLRGPFHILDVGEASHKSTKLDSASFIEAYVSSTERLSILNRITGEEFRLVHDDVRRDPLNAAIAAGQSFRNPCPLGHVRYHNL